MGFWSFVFCVIGFVVWFVVKGCDGILWFGVGVVVKKYDGCCIIMIRSLVWLKIGWN